MPAAGVERFFIAQLQSLTIDESLLNETWNRIHHSTDEGKNDLRGEHNALLENTQWTETVINAVSKPATDPASDSLRLDSLASRSEQLRQNQERCLYINEQIARIETGAPNHAAIADAADLTCSRVPQILNPANLAGTSSKPYSS